MLIKCGRNATGDYHYSGLGNILPEVFGQEVPDIQIGYRRGNESAHQYGSIVLEPLLPVLTQVTIDNFGRLIFSGDRVTAPVILYPLLIADSFIVPAPQDFGNTTSVVEDKGIAKLAQGYGYAHDIYGGKYLSIVDATGITAEALSMSPAVLGPTGMEEHAGFDANYGTGSGTIGGNLIESVRVTHVKPKSLGTSVAGSVAGSSCEVVITTIGDINAVTGRKADLRIRMGAVEDSFHGLLRIDDDRSAKATALAGAGRIVYIIGDFPVFANAIGIAAAEGAALPEADISVIPQ